MGKKEKEHRKKVQVRNNKIKLDKMSTEKKHKDFIMNLIKQEQEKGLFDNNQIVENNTLTPVINGPII